MRGKLALVGGLAVLAVWVLTRAEPTHEGAVEGLVEAGVEGGEPVQDGARELKSLLAPIAAGEEARAPLPVTTPLEVAPGSVSGRVLGPDGRPVRPSHVKFVWDENGKKRELHEWVAADGFFELVPDDPRAVGDLLAYVYEHEFAPAALTGVRAGASGLELRLGPADFFELDVRDTWGRPLAVPPRPTFSWRLGGHSVADDARGVANHPLRFARSPVPFFFHLDPHGYVSARFGPFEPSEVERRLVIEVQSFPRVRGRVVQRRAPVPNVDVELWRIVQPAPGGAKPGPVQNWPMTARTDALGSFDLHYTPAGSYELRVFDPLHGGGQLGPLELDGVHDVDGLELELTTLPGAIEGRVLFPEGHGPADVFLLASCGHGLRRPRADGSYLLPGLPPGPCRIEVTESWEGLGAEDTWISFHDGRPIAPRWLAFHSVHEAEVRPGETTRLDIDLARAPRCSLVGSIRVDGRSPCEGAEIEGTRIVSVLLAREDAHGGEAFAELSSEGEFTIGVQEPGAYRLSARLYPFPSERLRWDVEDRVTLSPGTNTWSLELTSGSLRIRPGADGAALPVPSASWRISGELVIRVGEPEREPTGAFLFRSLPCGTIRVEAGSGSGVVLRECEIRAGETTELVWPQ